MPVVRIHGSAGPLAALAAQVGNQQGRMRQFDEASETFRNGLAGREMNLREQGQAFDQGQTSLLNSIMMARQRAMAAQTGMDPNLAPQDMMALQQFQQRQADLTAKKTAAKTALQHAYTNGIFGDPNSFDALGALQQLAPLADADPDAVLSHVGQQTISHVAQKYENDQRDQASKEILDMAGKFNDDRRAYVETLAYGVGGGYVKPADAYRAIGDLIDKSHEQQARGDLMELENVNRAGLLDREYALKSLLQQQADEAKRSASPAAYQPTEEDLADMIRLSGGRMKREDAAAFLRQQERGRVNQRRATMQGEGGDSIMSSPEYKIAKERLELASTVARATMDKGDAEAAREAQKAVLDLLNRSAGKDGGGSEQPYEVDGITAESQRAEAERYSKELGRPLRTEDLPELARRIRAGQKQPR